MRVFLALTLPRHKRIYFERFVFLNQAVVRVDFVFVKLEWRKIKTL